MDKIRMIGLGADEVRWVKLLVSLLRHPDPVVGEVARQALEYLEGMAGRTDENRAAG
ncbi:MAG TPA: hypothetical protein VMU80_16450 [Bryobacteraceae bacterium]|nr:hypothetical protein [Bryobacteraceae bacterium]